MRTFNDWFMSLPPAEQAILREDRWMLAERAFNAALTAQEAPVAKLQCSDVLAALQFNGCLNSAIDAITYLSQHDRPEGGQSSFNAEHLLQIADELKRVREKISN